MTSIRMATLIYIAARFRVIKLTHCQKRPERLTERYGNDDHSVNNIGTFHCYKHLVHGIPISSGDINGIVSIPISYGKRLQGNRLVLRVCENKGKLGTVYCTFIYWLHIEIMYLICRD
jgi:hypothetical protein